MRKAFLSIEFASEHKQVVNRIKLAKFPIAEYLCCAHILSNMISAHHHQLVSPKHHNSSNIRLCQWLSIIQLNQITECRVALPCVARARCALVNTPFAWCKTERLQESKRKWSVRFFILLNLALYVSDSFQVLLTSRLRLSSTLNFRAEISRREIGSFDQKTV